MDLLKIKVSSKNKVSIEMLFIIVLLSKENRMAGGVTFDLAVRTIGRCFTSRGLWKMVRSTTVCRMKHRSSHYEHDQLLLAMEAGDDGGIIIS